MMKTHKFTIVTTTQTLMTQTLIVLNANKAGRKDDRSSC